MKIYKRKINNSLVSPKVLYLQSKPKINNLDREVSEKQADKNFN